MGDNVILHAVNGQLISKFHKVPQNAVSSQYTVNEILIIFKTLLLLIKVHLMKKNI